MNAILQSVLSRQQQFHTASKSLVGYDIPSNRGYAVPITKDKLGYSTAGSLLMDGEVDEKRMSAKFVVSTVEQDRQGDIVPPESCIKHLANYRRNPVVFFGHEMIPFPIATCESPDGQFCFWPEPDNGRIVSQAWFHGKTSESTQIFGLVAVKALRMASLGFAPIAAQRISRRKAEPRLGQRPSISPQGYMFDEIDVVEWSVVGVPANSGAEVIAVGLSKGLLFGDKISEVMRKALAPLASPRSGAVRGNYNPIQGNLARTIMNIQSIILAKKAYPVLADAKLHATSKGWDTSDVEDVDGSFVFHQITASRCEGLELPIASAENPDATFVCYKSLKDEGGAPMQPQVMPPGAGFLADTSAMLDEMANLLNQHNGVLEHPPIREACMKGIEEVAGHRKSLDDLMAKEYPDLFGKAEPSFTEDFDRHLKEFTASVRKSIDDAAMGPTGDEFIPKPGAKFLAKVAGCFGKAMEYCGAAVHHQEHPPVAALCKALATEIPVRRDEVVKMMKEHYADAHDHLGWGKKALEQDADKKEKAVVAADDEKVVEKSELVGEKKPDDDPIKGMCKFLADVAKMCSDMVDKMAKGDGKNPYEVAPGFTPSTKAVDPDEEEEDAMSDEEEKQLAQLTKRLEEVCNETSRQARQMTFLTGGKVNGRY
jgi:hypothetical protein